MVRTRYASWAVPALSKAAPGRGGVRTWRSSPMATFLYAYRAPPLRPGPPGRGHRSPALSSVTKDPGQVGPPGTGRAATMILARDLPRELHGAAVRAAAERRGSVGLVGAEPGVGPAGRSVHRRSRQSPRQAISPDSVTVRARDPAKSFMPSGTV